MKSKVSFFAEDTIKEGIMLGWITRAALGAIVVFGLSIGSATAALKSETVTYKVGDRELTGYLVYDDARVGKRPGVLVVHEWWGHDAYARRRADMLARQGYTAF
ncbi:MAG: dienelactone hydrolase family protein, partial [Alphaproteobacteria bacterium]|nr:dienelactone hydrolase family protein [Alphaproteobacteria bacterium]